MNYVRIFSELPGSQVLVVCDKDPNRLQEAGRRFPGVILTTDYKQALTVNGVDAVVICTQATTHHEIALHSFCAGKHALIEKPLATTTADADDIWSAAEANGRVVMAGHTFIYNPGIRKIKEYIEDGEVGRVYYLYSSRTNLGPIRHDVNALWDLAPHDVAIFNYLLDATPVWVSAVGARVLHNRREDVGFISLGYPNNVVGHIHVSWADPNKVREVVVVGSDKRVAFNDLNPIEQVRIFEKSVAADEGHETSAFGESRFLVRDGNIISPRVEASEPLKNQSAHFLECVAQSRQPLSGGREGRDVVRVMEAIDRSLKRGGAPVKVSGDSRCLNPRQLAVAGEMKVSLASADMPEGNGSRAGNGKQHKNGHGEKIEVLSPFR
jgi:predicted dehydrogenase